MRLPCQIGPWTQYCKSFHKAQKAEVDAIILYERLYFITTKYFIFSSSSPPLLLFFSPPLLFSKKKKKNLFIPEFNNA